MKTACYKCNQSLRPESDYGRQDTCSKCGAHTKVCLNCLHYDRTRYNECTEPVAERVVDKEKGNFCDYFKPTDPSTRGNPNDPKQKAWAAAEALFKKKP